MTDAASPNLIELAPGVAVAPGALRWSFARSSGPGGQNVNKRSTKAEVRLAIADIPLRETARARLTRLAGKRMARSDDGAEVFIASDEHRSQAQNREACLERLRDLITAAAKEPKKRIATKPGKGAKRRRAEAKKGQSEKKKRRNWRDQ